MIVTYLFFPSLLLKFVDSIREKTRKIKTNKMLALLDPEIRPCASYQFWHAGTIFVCRNSFRKTRWGGKYLGTEPRHRGNSSQGMPFTASVVIALAGSLRVQVRKGQTLLGPRAPRPFSLSPPFPFSLARILSLAPSFRDATGREIYFEGGSSFVSRFPPTRNRLASVVFVVWESPGGSVASERFFRGINGVLWSARETGQCNDSLIVKKCIECLGESRARVWCLNVDEFRGVLVEKLHSRPHATMSPCPQA